MSRSIRLDAVLIQAVIAGALSFAHLHDLAEAAGQTGWKAWAYPVSVDLLLVAAWRRLRTARRDGSAWTWFVIALVASLGANVATAGLLDLANVPAWLRILVAGWPALAFLGGTLLVHTPAPTPPADVPALDPAPAQPAPGAPTVPAALLDHARKLADTHRASTGSPMTAEALAARLGLPAPMTDAIAAQLQLT
ncbi:DUF2637 domain-containing protein [Streptomyces bobili]|uniref:DUF2637 domain-containing protein n=1 Tax=Streptomyces bobili TaxID=67280 RepID=UPI003441D719